MNKLNVTSLFVASFLFASHAAPAAVPASAHESIEWCDIWISHANETNLPRVLLFGDSITRDYYPGVEKHLEGKAYVARLATSRFASDPVLLQEIALVLDNTKFDIIHFNNRHARLAAQRDGISPGIPKNIASHPDSRAPGEITLGHDHPAESHPAGMGVDDRTNRSIVASRAVNGRYKRIGLVCVANRSGGKPDAASSLSRVRSSTSRSCRPGTSARARSPTSRARASSTASRSGRAMGSALDR